MTSRTDLRTFLFSILGAGLVLGVALGGTASASVPTASATPSAGLRDGELITVRGSGFTPDTRIQVLECRGTAKHPPKDNHFCQGLTLDASGVTDGSGAYLNSPLDPTHRTRGFRVRMLPMAIDPIGIRCGPKDPCGVYVGEQENDFLRPHAFVALAFAGAPGSGSSPWAWVGLGAVGAAAAVLGAVLLRRRRTLR